MAQGFASARERNWWLVSGAALLAIYSSIGWAPLAAAGLRESGLLVPAFVAGLLLVILTIIAAGLRARLRGIELAALAGLLAVGLLVLVRIELVEERSHVVEYALLALFVYEALSERTRRLGKPRQAWIIAILIAFLAGFVDEVLQSITPGRVFDLRDIAFNAGAAIFAVFGRTVLARLAEQRTRD